MRPSKLEVMNKTLLALTFLFFHSCSHLPYKAPTKERFEDLKAKQNTEQDLEVHEQLALKYSFAKTFQEDEKNRQACELFRELSQNERFALQPLGRLRAIQTCPYSRERMLQALMDYDYQDRTHYTDEVFLRFAIEWLDSNEGPEDLYAEYSFRLSQYEDNLEQKIKTIQKALQLAPSKGAHDQYESKLKEIAPRFIEKPEDQELIKVARDLERARKFNQARSLYQRALNSDLLNLKDKLYALKRIGLTYKVQRSREMYLKKIREIGSTIKALNPVTAEDVKLKAESYIENQITLARAIWTAHEREKAQKILIDVQEEVSQTNSEHMAHIYYILGAMELEAKNKEKALNYFKQGLEFPTSNEDIRQYLSWSWAHNLFLMQEYERAINAMQVSLEKTDDSPSFQAKLLFWQGMSYLKLRKPDLARQRLRTAAKVDPHSYYSIMARHQLGDSYRPLKKKTKPVKIDRVFDWLVLLDEKTAASAYIEDLSERKNLPLKKRVQAYSQAELFHEAIFTYGRGASELDEAEKESFIPLIFPTAYLEVYQKYAHRYGVPYELALSITRQESAFNKDARSWADAFGLMQIIPEKAASLSKELDLKFEDFSALYEPEYNIQLGTYLLSKLLKRYDQQFPFFIAAYNAGDRPVQNWKKNRFEGNTLEFIEMIPYAETQKYVKLILRNMVIYRQLTSPREFGLQDIGIFIQ